MKVIAFTGYSGAGKTTLIESVIPLLKAAGQRVSVIKHAHQKFDIDREGKDSFRHRAAGAFEVLIASNKRLALQREFERETELSVHHLLAELYDGVDWVLVEGFRSSDLPKLEVWRQEAKGEPLFLEDEFIIAMATDSPKTLQTMAGAEILRPVLDINDAQAVASWLLSQSERLEYHAERYMSVKP